MSEEDEEMSNNGDAGQGNQDNPHWDRMTADIMYKKTREEIESKYFVL